MKATIENGTVKWNATTLNEAMCEYYRKNEKKRCICTSQESCLNCRFIHPIRGLECAKLHRLVETQDSENNDLRQDILDLKQKLNDQEQNIVNLRGSFQKEIKKLNDQILSKEIFESTHCGEF